MSIIDEVATGQPVDIDTLMGPEEQAPVRFPKSSERNRAASTALLTSSPVEVYQRIMSETQQGMSFTHDEVIHQEELKNKDMDMNAILGILGDPSVPDDVKQNAIQAINSDFNKDTRNRLKQHSLVDDDDTIYEAPSAEREAVRMGLADQLRESFMYEEYVQGLMNQNEVFKDEITLGKVSDFFAFLAPFAVSSNANQMLFKMAEEIKGNPSRLKATLLPGTFTKDLVDTLYNIPAEERMEVASRFMNIIEENSGVFFGSENQFNQWLSAKLIMERGGYTAVDEWIDNITGLLDIVGLGFGARALSRGGRQAVVSKKVEDIFRDIDRAEVAGTKTIPVAPGNAVGGVNQQKGRGMFELIVKSEGDAVSEALYGVKRDEAVFSLAMPKPLNVDPNSPVSLIDPTRNLRAIRPDEDVLRHYYDNGAIYTPPGEKEAARTFIINKFYEATGLHLHDNMTRVGVLDGGIVKGLSGVFSTPDGGFLRAEEAMDQARFAFRDFGVDESNITLLRRQGDEYVPVNLDEVRGVDGDYAIRVEAQREILPTDITSREAFDVKKNFFARIPGTFSGVFQQNQGSLQRWLMDPSSMFRPEVSSGAIVGFDRAVRIDKSILRLHDEFAQTAKNLDPEMRGRLMEHIVEANHRGLELSDMDLMARGFDDQAITAMKKWRQAWDTHFYFENADLVRTLNINNYQLFENNNARFFAKPTGKNYNIGRVYDPAQDAIVPITRQELDALYDSGGTVAQLRRPAHIDEDIVEFMAVRNTPDEYMRRITDRDQVLNYRKGYFQRQYQAAKYIEKNVYDAAGNVAYTRVVALSDNIPDAERFVQRMATQEGMEPSQWGRIRDDIRDLSPGTNTQWDLNSASGRIAQRHRGKALEDASGLTDVSASPMVLDPTESAIRSARSLSGRMAMRDYIENMKVRAIDQYADFFPKDQYGRPQWSSPADLRGTTTATAKELGDARSMVEYINYVESGYINSMDEVFKAGFNMVANTLGNLGMKNLERISRGIGTMSPGSLTKNAAFTGYLALNPFRQLIIQPHQSIRLAAYNPAYWASGDLTSDIAKVIAYKSVEATQGRNAARSTFTKLWSKEDLDLIDFIDDTGLLASVDRSNLVRGPLVDIVDSQNAVLRGTGKAIAVPRKMGYDLGEQTNLVMHLLNVRNSYLRKGSDITDKAVRDEIHGVARNLSWDMNMGGDFPYNQNWAAPVLQFAQIPHKAIAQYTSRKITRAEKMRLAAADVLMFGVPGAAIMAPLIGEENLPQDKVGRDMLLRGTETVMWNAVLSKLAGRDVDFDLSALSPYELDGWGNILSAVIEGGIHDIIGQSPAANILWKDGSTLREALVTAGRYLGGYFDPYEGHDPATLLETANAFAELSTGWSNFQKARAIMAMGKAVDKQGNVLRDDAGFTEALMQVFGFPISEQRLYFEATNAIRADTQQHKDSVEAFYKSYQRILTDRGIYSDDPERATQMLGIMRSIYSDDPQALAMINGWIVRDMLPNDGKITRDALRYGGIDESGNIERSLNDYFLSRGEAERDKFMSIFRDGVDAARNFDMDEE